MELVEAVKSTSQREQLEYLLAERGQVFFDAWKFGVNTALRISDLLSITMQDVRDVDSERRLLTIKEAKTGKTRRLKLNNSAMAVVARRLTDNAGDKWLFQSPQNRKGKNDPQAISRRSISRAFAEAGEQIKPMVQIGTHSMRKTRGYLLHESGVPITHIAKILNHSNPATTMAYIGLDAAMVEASYDDLEA